MSPPAPSFHIETLGCRVNQYDEELLRREFFLRGFQEVGFDDRADVYVINTCTVTQTADKKSRQMIRRALRANPEGRVIATGCAVGNRAALGPRLPERVVTVSNQQKDRLLDVVRGQLPDHHARDEAALPDGRQNRARALLKVQDGCNQFCTFCIVPFVRGRARSKPPHDVLAEARALVAAGYKELVVTGVHVGWYGRDGVSSSLQTADDQWTLGRLMRLLAEHAGARRIRLSSVEPADFPMDMLDTMVGVGGICPHLHLALQHASDRVLERMRRGYTLAHYDAIVTAYFARFPDGALTADILVGFPGETDDDFQRLVEYLQSRPFAHLHVFPYSKRPGTAAARFSDHVDASVLQSRMDTILSIARKSERAFRERFVGREVDVLVEEVGPSAADGQARCKGTTDNYLTVQFDGTADQAGEIVRIRVVALAESGVEGVLRQPCNGAVS